MKKTVFLRWFSPPAIECDEENRHRIVLMNGMINASLVFVLLVFCGNLTVPSTPLRNYLIDLSLFAAFLVVRIVLNKGHYNAAGIAASVLGFLIIILSIVSDGTVRSTATFLLLLVISVSGILYNLAGIVVSTIASSLAVLALVFAENLGMLPRPDYSVSLLHWFLLTITFAIVGGIVFYSDHITQQAVRLSKSELKERQRAESDLRSVNEELKHRVIEVEKLQRQLREQALRDPLTDLYNRRYIADVLSRDLLRSARENCPLSVIIGDIDHFKSINDTYGHQVGDLFLVEVAQLFKRNIRGSDSVCRYGGEEFLFVLPGASVEVALRRAEEIRLQVARLAVLHEGEMLGITMSFGVAAFPVHGGKCEEIITKADQALYDAKRLGRNLVRIWSGSPDQG
jgi:diguanylate cyclase (GGDEF)-like protein